MDLAIKLYDNDHKIQAALDLTQKKGESSVNDFIEQIKGELICGQTELLEVEGREIEPITFKISLYN